mmetsp:Transcript_45308/g.114068  ORF Transcript_45308/g.114068 Transcript_45308/m.114068 type:complete len:482 (+) Transcript_45308:94-1539(+)
MRLLILPRWLPVVLVALCVSAAPVWTPPALSSDLACAGFGRDDPCRPGGYWDPLSKACVGNSGQACYQCYTGPRCRTRLGAHECALTSGPGNPLVFQEYWEEHDGHPCTQTPANYRSSYDRGLDTSSEPQILESVVRDLHRAVGNADPDNHTLVFGLGSTQVMAAAMYAFAELMNVTDVLVAAPFYSGYAGQVLSTLSLPSLKQLRWNPAADPTKPSTMQIMTLPNNPDGNRFDAASAAADASRLVYDMPYNWPQFTRHFRSPAPFPAAMKIFSASKLTGHAGSRLGWALVKDPNIAAKMKEYIHKDTLGLSVDGWLRVRNVLAYMDKQTPPTSAPLQASGSPRSPFAPNPALPFFVATQQAMTARFQALADIFKCELGRKNGFLLDNKCASYPCGAYAWVKCPAGYSCSKLFQAKGNLTGSPGPAYGAPDEYLRLTLMMRSVEIEQLLERVRAVVCTTLPPASATLVVRAQVDVGPFVFC